MPLFKEKLEFEKSFFEKQLLLIFISEKNKKHDLTENLEDILNFLLFYNAMSLPNVRMPIHR